MTAYTDLLAGDLDVMGDIPPESVADARQRFGRGVLERESSVVTYLGFPLYDPRFGNRDLRRALSMAIDREAITATLLPDQVPARAMVSPLVAGARPDPCGATCHHDPAAARNLFDAAGGYDGTLELWLNAGAGHEQWLEAVANQLRASLGIADIRFVGLAPADLATTLAGRAAGGPFRTAWVMDYPSPQNYLEPLFSSTGAANDFGYADAEVDRLIAEGNAAATMEAGLDAHHAAEDRILADLPAIPLFFGKVLAVHSERVEGVVVDPLSRINLAEISVVGA
jgi:ABC-type oligopeptide transport system substrate-binding subunit